MDEVLQKLDPEDREWLEAMMEYLLDVEASMDYHKALLKGELPGSEDILKRSLYELYRRRANNDPVVREA